MSHVWLIKVDNAEGGGARVRGKHGVKRAIRVAKGQFFQPFESFLSVLVSRYLQLPSRLTWFLNISLALLSPFH